MARPDPVVPEEELEEGRMPFFDHLRELRDRLRNAAIFFVLGTAVSWFFAPDIYDWLLRPLERAWAQHPRLGPTPTMNFGSIVEPFWVYMSVALWSGIFVASPFIFHQLWKFIAPGLYKRERRYAVVFGLASAMFFVGGALFCYRFVLEQLFTFLLGYSKENLQATLFMREYLDFTRNMMLAFGAVFELPILIYFLAMSGMVTPKGLWKFNRWFVVLAFIIGAVLTPSPDVVSQVMMALPMIVLYNIAILASFLALRGRARELGMPPEA